MLESLARIPMVVKNNLEGGILFEESRSLGLISKRSSCVGGISQIEEFVTFWVWNPPLCLEELYKPPGGSPTKGPINKLVKATHVSEIWRRMRGLSDMFKF